MTNEEIIENGKKLFQSAENLRKSAPDLDALMLSLWEAIVEENFFENISDLGDEDGGGKWLSEAYAYNAGVMSHPKRSPGQKGRNKSPKKVGTISIITRLCNSDNMQEDTPAWPWLNQACLILGWHPKNSSEDTWAIENFEPNDDSLTSISHLRNGLWSWRNEDEDYAYFFLLPIFLLRNENDLKRFALRPLKILFEADDPVGAAQEALRDVPVLVP